MLTLTVFSRPNCHLCDVMIDELKPLANGVARIEVIDISQDEDLEAEYGLQIPVLVAGDIELSRYRLDSERVRSFLAGAGRESASQN